MTEAIVFKVLKLVVKVGFIAVPFIYYKRLAKKRDKALEDFYTAYEREDYDRAIWLIDKYIEENPKDFGGYLHKGNVLKDLERVDEAIDYLKIAIEKKELVFESQKILADCYLELDQPDLAVDHYNKAIKSEKDRLSARFNRGIAYMHLESYDKAIKDFKYVLRREEGDKTYIEEELATAYLITGDLDNYAKYRTVD
jgi:tetratricopeptide (TPR) repeat protein